MSAPRFVRSSIARAVLLSAASALTLFVLVGAAQAKHGTVVGPGDSIQAAVNAADPGDTILVYGTHRENVAVHTDGLTLRGVGATILPPTVPTVHACFDPNDVDEAVHGICVVGDVDFHSGEVARYVNDVTVTGFTVRGFTGSGLITSGAAHATLKGNVLENNGDAGISDAQSTDTRVLGNEASGSRFGIFVLATEGSEIAGNSVHDNCVGTFAFLGAAQTRVAGNIISHNTRACAATTDEWPAVSGVGVLLIGVMHTDVTANVINGNLATGETSFSGGVVLTAVPESPPATGNTITHNVLAHNDPDLFWDRSDTENVFAHNVCRTSSPTDLCG
jgi:parallel beta-helix repeat protein